MFKVESNAKERERIDVKVEISMIVALTSAT